MKILLTGCAGFIGSHTLDRLLADGLEKDNRVFRGAALSDNPLHTTCVVSEDAVP